MTFREMIIKNPDRSIGPPGSIFSLKTPSGEIQTWCWASFLNPNEVESIGHRFPEMMDWEVVKEHFTQQEYHEHLKSQKSP